MRIEFRYDGGGTGKGADLVLYVEGGKVGEGRTEHSSPYLTSLDETLDVGTDAGTPVTNDHPVRGNEFNGRVKWVQVYLEPDDHSHMIGSGHMAHVRLVKQQVGYQDSQSLARHPQSAGAGARAGCPLRVVSSTSDG